jgi:hypothetical protein
MMPREAYLGSRRVLVLSLSSTFFYFYNLAMIGSFSLYQLLVPLFALLMIAKATSRFLRHQLSIRELIVWLLIWCGASFVALFPDPSMAWFATVTGIKSGINALIFFVLVVLLYGFLRLYIMLEDTERKLTELVRRIALKELEENNKSP